MRVLSLNNNDLFRVSSAANPSNTPSASVVRSLLFRTTLDAGDFAGLPMLTDLRLESNDLTTLADGVFDGLAALEILNLRHNQLQSLPTGCSSR